MYVTTINKERIHEFAREQEKTFERLWREEKEGGKG